MTINISNRIFRSLTTLLTPGPATRIAKLLWPLMLIIGDLSDMKAVWRKRVWAPPKHLPGDLQFDFDFRVVPYRAQHPGIFARVVHRILRAANIVFVVNVAPGMGHNTVELDYFMRLVRSGKIPKKRYVLLRMSSPFHNDTLALYRQHFWFTSNRALLNNLLSPVIAHYKDIRLNVGLSRLRWQLRDDGTCSKPPADQTYLYQIDKKENRTEWMRYYALRGETRDIAPLREGLVLEPALRAFLGAPHDQLALLHVKYHVGNATARPTDPLSYLSTIRWLQSEGYKVVMIGREKMPAEFAALGVLDYASSPLACYRHDLELVAHASVVITAGSGIAMMPDCMDIPLVYLNSWHIGMPLTSERCIIVPTLVAERDTGRLLTVSEQCELYWSLEDKGDEVFPTRDYEPREATEDEVLAATREALALKPDEKLSQRQQAYRLLTMKGDAEVVGSRISHYFADKHAQILQDDAQKQYGDSPRLKTATGGQ